MNYRIPIAKPLIGEEEKRAVLEVLSSGYLVQGKNVETLERGFAKHIGVKHCVAVNSGTAALHLALLALGVKRGDEVITSAFSFSSSANSILFCGATPVFADIDPKTFNVSPDSIENKITSKTKCIMPVHLYGQPAEMGKIKEIADRHDLFIVEDACQAHGAEYGGVGAGGIGDAGCFSFYPTKNMTTGEGGMVTTNDPKIAEKSRLLRNHGQHKQYYQSILGYNFRMLDFVAVIGVEQLKKLDRFNRKRVENAKYLTKSLSGIEGIVTPYVSPNVKHVFHQYTIRVRSGRAARDMLQKSLAENGVQTRIYYPIPIHKQEFYQKLGYDDVLPESEAASNEVLSIPVHPSLKEEDLKFVCDKIKAIVG
jgi:dTDP-4-amino-4,6-dideoxygalactose transaminase